MNRVILIGNVGRDPSVKQTETTDKLYASFPLATKKFVNKEEITTWHNIVVLDSRLAERARDRIQKGTLVSLEGEIEIEITEGEDGKKKYYPKIILAPFNSSLETLARWKEQS